jgi:SAM-dependent methyltransferase
MRPRESDGYIHGTEPREQERLAGLNRLTNAAFVEFLKVERGIRVLEVGSGLGILAADVARAAAGVTVIGVERSPEQIAAARLAPNVTYVQGDAHELAFPDASFDLVYGRYILEHVQDPARVVREMARVVRPGGRVAACENDISLFRVDPPCPTFDAVWTAFQEYQARLGGDARVGRRLHRLFRGAGLDPVELSVQPDVHWHALPTFAPWLENTIGNIESGRTGLVGAGLCTAADIERAIGELRALIANPEGSSIFVWNRAVGVKPG